MKLSKVSHHSSNTYIVIRANGNDGDYITITVQGHCDVEMNSSGNALSVKPKEKP